MSDDPVVYPDGMKVWYSNGVISREHGPARILPDGTREWWTNGVRNRSDGGPARILPDGTWEWWKNGVLVQSKKMAPQFTPCDHHIQAEELAQTTPERWQEMEMEPVSSQALEHAMRWLNALVVIPCGDGDVQIGVHYGGRDFELDFDDSGPVFLLAACGDRRITFVYTEDKI